MLKNLKSYYKPDSIEEALKLLNDEENKNRVIGGGTVLAFSNDISLDGLVDIEKLDFNEITKDDELISIGSKITLREVQKSQVLSSISNGILNKCASYYLTALHRNQATLGGVLFSGYSNTELISALISLDADLRYVNNKGENKISLIDLYKENPQKILYNSIIKCVTIKEFKSTSNIQRVSRSKTDIPMISLIITNFEDDSKILAFSAVENLPVYYKFGADESLDAIIKKIQTDFNPISDIRATSQYRKETAVTLTKRLLEGAKA